MFKFLNPQYLFQLLSPCLLCEIG
ncbi:ComF family protein, partial [Acinetobacter baumannii]